MSLTRWPPGRLIPVLAVAFVVLPLASAAAAASWSGHAPQDFEDAERSPLQFPVPPRGHPLVRTPVEVWLPTLLMTGDLSEAVAVAHEGAGGSLWLTPMGDLDGDGRGDFVLSTAPSPEDDGGVTVLTAVSGRDFTPLWTLEVPGSSYWYPLGDVDGDGADDLVLLAWNGSGTGTYTGTVAGTYAFSMMFEERAEVVSGASGATLFVKDLRSTFEFRGVFAGAVVAYVDVARYEFALEFLDTSMGRSTPGLHVVKFFVDSQSAGAFAFPAGSLVAWHDVVGIGIERLGADGRVIWTYTMEPDGRYPMYVDAADYTGDGTTDLVLGSSEPTHGGYASGAGWFGAPVDQVRVVLVDGATGRERWVHETDRYVGSAMVLPAGPVRGDQRDVLLHQFSTEGTPPVQGTRITLLDGGTGEPAATKRWDGQLVLSIEFADADGDGKGDLVLLRFPTTDMDFYTIPPGTELSIVRADFTPIWSMPITTWDELFAILWDYPSNLPDFDGDGVPDLTIFDDAGDDQWRARTLSGATGTPIWEHVFDHQVMGAFLVEDVTGDGGIDVAVVRFDVPRRSEADDAFWASLNLANHTATLDVLRGSDAELVWSRIVHDPALEPNRTAKGWPMLWVEGTRDVNGNGVDDVVLNLDFFDFGRIYFDGEVGMAAVVPSPGGERGLNFALVLEGADGSVLKRYPTDLPSSGPATLGPGANASGSDGDALPKGGFLPGPAFPVLLVATVAGLVAALRRRR